MTFPISHVRVIPVYSCTHCDEHMTEKQAMNDYSTLAPYINEWEAFCSENCAQLEYAARKANNDG